MDRVRRYKHRRTSNENSLNISPFAIQAQQVRQTQQVKKVENHSTSSSSMEKQLQTSQESGFNFAHIAISRPSSGVTTAIQTKLEIGAVGDKYEQQADQVADRVVESINKHQ